MGLSGLYFCNFKIKKGYETEVRISNYSNQQMRVKRPHILHNV
jgi:hypothetical protein